MQAKNSAPIPGFAELSSPEFRQIFDHTTTLIAAPETYLLTDSLASVLAEKEVEVVWICFGPEDRDPGMLLLSLLNSVEKAIPGISVAILSKMRRQPGPVTGWEPIFSTLAVEINRCTNSLLFILEGVENFAHSSICIRLVSAYFLDLLGKNIRRILISKSRLPKSSLFTINCLIRAQDLRVSEEDKAGVIRNLSLNLSQQGNRRAMQLAKGKLSILACIKESLLFLDPKILDQEIKHSYNLEDLLNRIVRLWMMENDQSVIEILSMSLSLGYSHPVIRSIPRSDRSLHVDAGIGGSASSFLSQEPIRDSEVDLWHQPLENEWDRLRGVWRKSLQTHLKGSGYPDSEYVCKTVEFLLHEKAVCSAVNLCFQQDNIALAAEIIANSACEMMDLGQWATLISWIKNLSQEDFNQWPILEYVGAKIMTASGEIESAHKGFAHASQLYTHVHDPGGECRSLLAESALAAWRGDTIFSKERALSAFTLAQRTQLTWYEIWAGWHLGTQAIDRQDYIDALEWYRSASNLAKSSGYHSVWEVIEQACTILQRQIDLDLDFQSCQQALIANEKARKDNLTRLQNLTTSPFENLDDLLEEYGWTNLPLMPITSAWVEPIKPARSSWNVLSQLLSLFNPGWDNRPVVSNQILPQNDDDPDARMSPHAGVFPAEAQVQDETGLSKTPVLGPSAQLNTNSLKAYLLGQFSVEISGSSSGWMETKSRMCII